MAKIEQRIKNLEKLQGDIEEHYRLTEELHRRIEQILTEEEHDALFKRVAAIEDLGLKTFDLSEAALRKIYLDSFCCENLAKTDESIVRLLYEQD